MFMGPNPTRKTRTGRSAPTNSRSTTVSIRGIRRRIAGRGRDGLLNGEEYSNFGTDPFDSDTDKDGLTDGEEVGYVKRVVSGPWYDTSEGEMCWRCFPRYIGRGVTTLPLSFPVFIDGCLRPTHTICVDGGVYRLTPGLRRPAAQLLEQRLARAL
jgi:hypothetical protein